MCKKKHINQNIFSFYDQENEKQNSHSDKPNTTIWLRLSKVFFWKKTNKKTKNPKSCYPFLWEVRYFIFPLFSCQPDRMKEKCQSYSSPSNSEKVMSSRWIIIHPSYQLPKSQSLMHIHDIQLQSITAHEYTVKDLIK